MMSTSITELVKLLVPTYQKHLSLEDLKGIIAFYESPLGIKYAEKTPFITQESMAIGQQWGMLLGQKIAKKMEKN